MDPLRQLARRAFPNYKGRAIRMVAHGEDIRDAAFCLDARWVAINMDTGASVQVPAHLPHVTIPAGRRDVAYVLHVKGYGLRVFVHPSTISRNLLPQHASLTALDRITLSIAAHFKPDAWEKTAAAFGLSPTPYREAQARLLDTGYLNMKGRPTRRGRDALRPYWDLICLRWA